MTGLVSPVQHTEDAASAESRLQSLIVSCDLGASEWIREDAIAKRLGVSRTPIREACARLSSKGLLEHVPRRGYRLPPLSSHDLNEIYPVLVELEVLSIRQRSLGPGGVAAKLRSLNFDPLRPPKDTAAFAAVDFAWHDGLVAGSGNRVLVTHFRMLYTRVSRYIHYYWTEPDPQTSADEHDQIARAIERDDTDLAIALLRTHRRCGLERIQRLIDAGP